MGITDGVPCTPDDPMSGSQTCRDTIPNPVPSTTQAKKARTWAKTLKSQAVTVVTIAVGAFGQYGQQFINDISSAPASKYVFNPSSWNDLPQLIKTILANICPDASLYGCVGGKCFPPHLAWTKRPARRCATLRRRAWRTTSSPDRP